jgi:hypothetical protein
MPHKRMARRDLPLRMNSLRESHQECALRSWQQQALLFLLVLCPRFQWVRITRWQVARRRHSAGLLSYI